MFGSGMAQHPLSMFNLQFQHLFKTFQGVTAYQSEGGDLEDGIMYFFPTWLFNSSEIRLRRPPTVVLYMFVCLASLL